MTAGNILNITAGQRLYDFSLAASKAGNQNEIWEHLTSALAQYGVQWINYAFGPAESPLIYSNMTTEWIAHYSENYFASDFVVKHCADALHPMYLDSSFYKGEAAIDPTNNEMFDDLSYTGSSGGMGIPLAKQNSELFGASGVIFNLGSRDTNDVMKHHGEEISLIMYAAHQYLGGMELQIGTDIFAGEFGAPLKKNALLTVREKDVLRYLASGLRPGRIAEQMDLQVATVNLHISKARNRLGVATREHAIVTAINTRQLIL